MALMQPLAFAENGVCKRQLAEVACDFFWGDSDRLRGLGSRKHSPRAAFCLLPLDELRLHEAKWLRIFSCSTASCARRPREKATRVMSGSWLGVAQPRRGPSRNRAWIRVTIFERPTLRARQALIEPRADRRAVRSSLDVNRRLTRRHGFDGRSEDIGVHTYPAGDFLNWSRLATKFGIGREEKANWFNDGVLKLSCSGDQVSFQPFCLA